MSLNQLPNFKFQLGSGTNDVWLELLASKHFEPLTADRDSGTPEAVCFVGKVLIMSGTDIANSPDCFSSSLKVVVEVMSPSGDCVCPPEFIALSKASYARIQQLVDANLIMHPNLPRNGFECLNSASPNTCFILHTDRVRFEVPVPQSKRVYMPSRPRYEHETKAYHKDPHILDASGSVIPYSRLRPTTLKGSFVYIQAIPCL
ncbi:hypothetical protein NMY22_g2385 [Coprinellus aureogranulatus]|nr:hypothetical protein NMY22_g2385 [Coprinellus aureogranulatus]